MKNLTLEISKKQMKCYYAMNDIDKVAKPMTLIFLNSSEKGIQNRALDVRCGLERSITDFGKELKNLKIREATEEEVIAEKQRVQDIEEEFDEICRINNEIHEGNERVVNATSEDEFINAYL